MTDFFETFLQNLDPVSLKGWGFVAFPHARK